jgi:hypothetical protein
MFYDKNHRSDNMMTIQVCHRLLTESIAFDVEYAIKFPRIKPVDPIPKGTHNRKKLKRGTRQRGSRFDIVIISDNQIVGIIETKSHPVCSAQKQVDRYQSFGVPVYLCDSIDKIESAVIFSKNCLKDQTSIFG